MTAKEVQLENVFEDAYWNLCEEGKKLKPLTFSNNKNQENIVKEVVNLIKSGKKIIFIHGVCGTGKSAIALNIARVLGKTSIVVPIKSLQKQYEKDYTADKYVLKKNNERMKIALITGRENHDSVLVPGVSCADPFLPDTIKITEKNRDILKDFYFKNPFINSNSFPEVKEIRRISIAPSNPYWSPIIPASVELNQLKDAKKKPYKAIEGREYVFYHRKQGCGYYDQYDAYLSADVIIFNAVKYLSEMAMGRKPQTEVEIIDEADEFLDSFSNSLEINLTRLSNSLRLLSLKSDAGEPIGKILEIIENEEKNKRALGVDESAIFNLEDTKIKNMLEIFMKDKELDAEIRMDETNYCNNILDEIKFFSESFKDLYLTYKFEEENLIATLVSTNLSKKFRDIVDKNKALVLMSGTLHSKTVLKKIFGIENFEIVEAETLAHKNIEIAITGKEFNCKYETLKSKETREKYLKLLSSIVEKSKKPTLIHVNAFSDLPSEEELSELSLFNLISSKRLREIQKDDKTGMQISLFKAGVNDILFSTKCSRGIDFPGETCNTVIFTKYPNPNIKDTFWKVLNKTHPTHYWDFYKDKADREFLQRIYRAVRSKDDHVIVMSPDLRIINSVRELQKELL
jgi:Rad3-related DNA helicase